jgi:hypothetical protein
MDITMHQRSFIKHATRWHERTKFAVSASKTFCQATRRYNVDTNFHTRHSQNLKSYLIKDMYMHLTSQSPPTLVWDIFYKRNNICKQQPYVIKKEVRG